MALWYVVKIQIVTFLIVINVAPIHKIWLFVQDAFLDIFLLNKVVFHANFLVKYVTLTQKPSGMIESNKIGTVY